MEDFEEILEIIKDIKENVEVINWVGKGLKRLWDRLFGGDNPKV